MTDAVATMQAGFFTFRRMLVAALLSVWFAACALLLGNLGVAHVVSMPDPEAGSLAGLLASLDKLRQQQSGEFVVHVLAADCSCTEGLFRHLLSKGPDHAAEEMFLFVAERMDDNNVGKARQARQAGFRFVSIRPEELAAIGLEAAPVLAVFDQSRSIRYLGGYYDHSAAANPRDQQIRQALATGDMPAPLPIYGCAVSERLKQAFDPYGIVYDS